MNIKERIILLSLAIVVYITSIVLTIIWYDWKLVLIIVLFQFGWNLDNYLKQSRHKYKGHTNIIYK
jgi:hypothetical protein